MTAHVAAAAGLLSNRLMGGRETARKRRVRVFTAALLVACGQSQDIVDGGNDGGLDGTLDVAHDAVVDAMIDAPASSDGSIDAGPKYPPALWSFAVDHVSFADGAWSQDSIGVALQAGAGMKLGNNTYPDDAAVTTVFGDGDGGIKTAKTWPYDKNVIEVGSLGPAGPQQVTLMRQGSFSPAPMLIVNAGSNLTIWSDNASPIPRMHEDGVSQVMAFDSLPSGTYSTLGPGGLLIVKRGFGNRVFPGAPSTLAVDSVRGDTSSRYCIAGRINGSFDFATDAGPVTGNGFFIADFVPALTALQWIDVFGGVPLYAVGTTAPEGTGIRLWYDVSDGSVVFTFPFTGTVDFGGGKTFTAANQATAMGVVSASGLVTLAKVFTKGPGASGKPSRPSAYALKDSADQTIGYRLLDTVWDTMDLGGTTATANAGADVVIADFDAAGTLKSYRIYGGPGDDEAYRVLTEASSLSDYIILGHSMQSIDFGNGALPTSSPEGEVWLARIAP